MNEALNLHKSAFSLASLSLHHHLQHFLLVRMVGAASHSNLFLCNWMQARTAYTVVRKIKWRALAYKGRNELIWENLDERMELLGHLKIIVPLDINLVEFASTKQSQTGSHT